LVYYSQVVYSRPTVLPCGPWIPIDASSIQPIPGDTYHVKYLLAPLMECEYGDYFAAVGSYHGGIGIFSANNTQFAWTFEYDATPNFTAALMPQIDTDHHHVANNLTWDNGGGVFVYNGVNGTYWAIQSLICSIDATTFSSFLSWIGAYNVTNPYYYLWSVWTASPGGGGRQLVPSNDCFTFVAQSFQFFQSQGVPLLQNQLNMSLAILYSDQNPSHIPNDWLWFELWVVPFYANLVDEITQEGVIGFFDVMKDLMKWKFYILYTNQTYYTVHLISPDILPWFGPLTI